MNTITCICGAVIPRRPLYDYYRLTPRHRELRDAHRLGVVSSERRRFLDAAEEATRQGQTVLRFVHTPRTEAYSSGVNGSATWSTFARTVSGRLHQLERLLARPQR